MTKVQAVTICIHFSHVLKYIVGNKKHFDRWIIVTREDDKETIDLCQKNDIEYIFSQRIHENGAQFARGKAINEGLSLLDKSGWILSFDADIILPDNIQDIFNALPDTEEGKQCLYGPIARRAMGVGLFHNKWNVCTKSRERLLAMHKYFSSVDYSRDQYEKILMREIYKAMSHRWFESKIPSIEDQWRFYQENKWEELPYIFEAMENELIGYFQLFHGDYLNQYPEISDTVWWDDVAFRESFPKERRIILDFECLHVGYNGTTRQTLLPLDECSKL